MALLDTLVIPFSSDASGQMHGACTIGRVHSYVPYIGTLRGSYEFAPLNPLSLASVAVGVTGLDTSSLIEPKGCRSGDQCFIFYMMSHNTNARARIITA